MRWISSDSICNSLSSEAKKRDSLGLSPSSNALNRLTVMEPTPAGITQGYKKHRFTYDYMSRRVRKQTYEHSGSSWNPYPSLDEKYLYSGWHLVAVYDGLNANQLLRTFTWGADVSGSVGGLGGIGGLLSVQEHSGTHAGKYLYVYDATGNVTQLVKASDGTVVAKYQYDPFGRTRVAAGNGYQHINPFRYQTKFTDNDSGLIYYGYRYYSHGLGRFLNQDPIGESGGLNLYAFVGNDPVNAREYLGLSVIRPGGPDEYHWWREGLNASDDGNSNWRQILTHAYNLYYSSWTAGQRNDFQVATLAAYWASDTDRHDEASLDRAVGKAVDDAVTRLMGSSKSSTPTPPPSAPVAAGGGHGIAIANMGGGGSQGGSGVPSGGLEYSPSIFSQNPFGSEVSYQISSNRPSIQEFKIDKGKGSDGIYTLPSMTIWGTGESDIMPHPGDVPGNGRSDGGGGAPGEGSGYTAGGLMITGLAITQWDTPAIGPMDVIGGLVFSIGLTVQLWDLGVELTEFLARKKELIDIDKLCRKHNLNRDDFGRFIHQKKPEDNRRPNENYSWEQLKELAKEFKELYGKTGG
jgi:RHS repeat-associated protein